MKTGIKAIDIMSTKVVTCTPGMKIDKVAKIMNKFRIGGVPVVKDGKKLVGILTERDIMRKVIALDKKPSETKVSDVMIAPPRVIGEPNEDMQSLSKKIGKYDVTRIPIISKGKVVGIVTNRDILKHSPEFMDVLLEQAKIKGRFRIREEIPTAFGRCELCGSKTNLMFKKGQFVCDICIRQVR